MSDEYSINEDVPVVDDDGVEHDYDVHATAFDDGADTTVIGEGTDQFGNEIDIDKTVSDY